MAEFKLKRGYDLRIQGKSETAIVDVDAKLFAIKPTDFRGLTPKLEVKVGDSVKAGSVLFHDKKNETIKFSSPVSGKVVAINRGERRRILEVVVEADGKEDAVEFKKYGMADLGNLSQEDAKKQLLESGLWVSITERPYGRIAHQDHVARDIFISGMDTAPLAADPNILVKENNEVFQAGLKVLSKLTSGDVYLSLDGAKSNDSAFTSVEGVKVNSFKGPHPAGNVGIQIHHIKPINRGDLVWTVKPADVIAIGRLFTEGRVNSTTIVNVAGENANEKKYYRVKRGAEVKALFANGIKDNSRIISGNVLTGTKISEEGFVGFFDNTVSVIPEGNEKDFLGWVRPGTEKESYSGTFLSKFFPKKEYSHSTNLHGGARAFILSGYYEEVLPMDMYPVHLLKACLAEDIEEMEGLGIYEVIEEDLALCEYIDPSKIEAQEMLGNAIDFMIKEM
jgi:Na+-transporting NADH:ubiquinone oxidoreductase subunit A